MGAQITIAALQPQKNGTAGHAGSRLEASNTYLVTIVTAQRAQIFNEMLLARMVVRHLKELEFVSTLAYVIMPDHIHWLLRLSAPLTIKEVVQTAKSNCTKSINRFYGREGPVWQSGFYDHPIKRGDDLKYIARHIISNPVRAGLAKSVRDYAHWDAVWL